MQRSATLRDQIQRQQKQGKKLIDLFFHVWKLQTSEGRHCTGENPHDNAAFKDPRFQQLDAEYAHVKQCVYGLCRPDPKKKHLRHEKLTTFVSSTKSIKLMEKQCDGKHEHTPLQGYYKSKALTKWAEEYPWKLAEAIHSSIEKTSAKPRAYFGHKIEIEP